MTISRILLLPFCLFKIVINFDKLKNIFFSNEKISNKYLNLFIFIIFSITCSCASLYQNIVGYITIIGGFFVPLQNFLIPQYYLRKLGNGKRIELRKLCSIIFVIILCILGFLGGIFGIIDIFKGE